MLENIVNKVRNLNNGLKLIYFLLIVSNLYFYYLLIKGNVLGSLFVNFSVDLLLWFVEIVLITGVLTVIGVKIKGSRNKNNPTGVLVYLLIFTVLGILGSYFTVKGVSGVAINMRDSIMVIGTISGGPIAGFVSGILVGIWRYSLGGVTALACSLTTFLAPIITIIIYYLNNKKFNLTQATIFMFLYLGLDMLIILLFGASDNRFYVIVSETYLPMLIGNVLGVITYFLAKEFGK